MNASFVKPPCTILSCIFGSMFIIDAINLNIDRNSKLVLFFTRLFRGGKSGAYKIKPGLFLFAFGLTATIKTLY